MASKSSDSGEPPRTVRLVRGVLDPGLASGLLSAADRFYYEIARRMERDGEGALGVALPPGERYVARASSVTLGAVADAALWGALLTAIARGAVGESLRAFLGGAVVCDLDQSWVRRQYAPHRYHASHAPHGWHQDGALRFDFLALGEGAPAGGALLPMMTCWLALTACGVDAPGVEFANADLTELLPVKELSHDAVRARCRVCGFWRPVLREGDGVLFPGGALHRTHVTEKMREDRTSVELRFCAADNLPERLAGDRLVAVD